MLLSPRVGVAVAVADAEDAPAADAPCQAVCQPLVTQDVVLAVPLETIRNNAKQTTGRCTSAIQIRAASGYELAKKSNKVNEELGSPIREKFGR